ncbi:MAG: hypothetical protein ACAH17_01955 [Candidatus Paceibacterota bacterium]
MLLYHLLPKELSGTKLYPLNELKKINPALYDRHASKYVGRETVMLQNIPLFDCLWNDVIFLSPVHPGKIVTARESCGVPTQDRPERDWLVIQSEKLDQHQLLLYRHRPLWLIEQEPQKAEYVPFTELSEAEKVELTEVPESALWSIRKHREKSLFQGFIPHLLYRGTIDVRDGELTAC